MEPHTLFFSNVTTPELHVCFHIGYNLLLNRNTKKAAVRVLKPSKISK